MMVIAVSVLLKKTIETVTSLAMYSLILRVSGQEDLQIIQICQPKWTFLYGMGSLHVQSLNS